MNYLIIDKRQRVEIGNEDKIATANLRLIEELDNKNTPHTLAYNDELEFEFMNGETMIKAKGEDLKKYTHILLRGHALHREIEYQYKRYIVDYIDEHNSKNPNKKILVQNSESIKMLPYYNKIALAMFCSKHNIPYFNTYYRTDGNYVAHREVLEAFPLIIKEYAGANRVEFIDGKEKIKKNVFKINSEDDYRQDYLKDLDQSRFFIQEFSDSGKDMRIFVKLGKVIAGWQREATEGFMTVKEGNYTMYNEPEPKVKEMVEKVAQLFKADFIAVDIMFMKDKPLLQEISFNPGFKAYETKIDGEPVNIAKEIITAFKEN
jgi:glutathione synthase/RimK-type ligase-like ATP-grasp enzyme